MKWLVLLVLAGLATASDLKLGDRIVATEQECERIYKLNENWSTKTYHEQAAQYVDLYFICVDSLNEDKYAYIDENKMDMSWYPGENDKFPVETSEGEKFVTKPPPRKPKDEESMKKKLSEYLSQTGGMMNPIYRLMNIQSEMSQEIVEKQVECEALTLYILKHPDDKDSELLHRDCINKLNCIKEKFMDQHKFTRKQYPDFFPILYKRRGTMIKTPPWFGKSVCETPDSPEGSKGELEKWMSGIEYIGEKLADIGEAGTDFIQKLVQKRMGGGDKVLTKEELDDLLTDVESVTISDDNEEDDENDENTYKVYGDVMMAKLAELEAKGVEIAHAQLEKAKPAIEKVQNIASLTGEKLKELEELKLKPVAEKTAHGLSNAESNFKENTKNAFEGVKDGLTIAGSVAKMATSKAKGESSIFMNKVKLNFHGDSNNEEATSITEEHKQNHQTASDNSQGMLSTLIDRMIHPEYLPNHYEDTQAPSLLQILKDMGRHGEVGKDEMSIDELEKKFKSLKTITKKRVEDLHLSEDQIKKSADVVKGVMHTLLTAASKGYGSAKGMSQQEIDKAKSVVDEMVNYATAEILKKDDGIKEEEDEEEASSDEDDAEDNNLILSDAADDGVTQKQETKTTISDKVTSQNSNTTPTVNQETSQTTADTRDEVDKSNLGDEVENYNENEGDKVLEKKLGVPDVK